MLPQKSFEVALACDRRYEWALRDFHGSYFAIRSRESDAFLASLEQGRPVYDEQTLERYVQDDVELLGRFAPDVVVGDFRLSLSVSARLLGIPYVAVSNCYWSPYWRPSKYTVPSLPLTRYLPVRVADAIFRLGRPAAFAFHCLPLNRVRRRYGLPSLGSDLRRIYTDADHVLYADLPGLFPLVDLPANHAFVGPLVWSPPVTNPGWWSVVPQDRPTVYVTMGSSGRASLLSEILHALTPLRICVIAATAGRKRPEVVPPNGWVAEYLPGREAAQRAQLVICNGGSLTTQQALLSGVAVVGIASNLDQFLNMQTICSAGAGLTLRADRFNAAGLRAAVEKLLEVRSYSEAAKRLSRDGASNAGLIHFQRIISQLARRPAI